MRDVSIVSAVSDLGLGAGLGAGGETCVLDADAPLSLAIFGVIGSRHGCATSGFLHGNCGFAWAFGSDFA